MNQTPISPQPAAPLAAAVPSREADVRPYGPEDAGKAIGLCQIVLSGERDPVDWAWKLEQVVTESNPPLCVAKRGGHLAGTDPTRALRLMSQYEAGLLLSQLDRPVARTETGEPRVGNPPGFDTAADRLWDHVRTRIPCAAVQDAACLDWRYVERPRRPSRVHRGTCDGRLDGYRACREDLVRSDGWRAGAIFDLLAMDQSTASALLHKAHRRMRAARCAYALALTHPEFQFAPVLSAAGFAPEPEHTVIFGGKVYTSNLDIETPR